MCLENPVRGQRVESSSFEVMLSTLLDDENPVLDVDDAYRGRGKYVFLDAREFAEFNVSHIPNAKFVGYEYFDLDKLKGLGKNTPIVVYCSVGKRSEDITLKLKSMGYTQVYNLYGGIFEWMNRGYLVVDQNGDKTQKIHAYNWFFGRFVTGDKVYN